jgi:AcrR family transcriptional regulator
VQRLLTAAERILELEGYEGLTVARLTKAARVPVGTFYQFFEGKDAIVEVLAQRYVRETAALIRDRIDEILDRRPGTRLAAAYEAFVDLYRKNPAYRAIRTGSYTSADLRRADNTNVDAAVDGIRKILTTRTGIDDGEHVRSVSRTLQLIVDALLLRASEIRSGNISAFISEAHSILTSLEEDAIKRLRRR